MRKLNDPHVERFPFDERVPGFDEAWKSRRDLAAGLLFKLCDQLLEPLVAAAHDSDRELVLSARGSRGYQHKRNHRQPRKPSLRRHVSHTPAKDSTPLVHP